MGYRNLRQCVDDLESTGQLVRLDEEIDAHLEAAEIHRRVCHNAGPAVLFTRVKNCRFPMVSNLFGTLERSRFLFRDTLESVRQLVQLKVDPTQPLKRPWRYWKAPFTALHMLPKRRRSGPILRGETTVSQLPQMQSWPADGGAFVTLPLIYTEHVDEPGLMKSNLGMYRIQFSGGRYERDREIGLHYQLHRGIGIHHTAAVRRGEPLRVNVFVGGTPAMTVAAVMPLPEGMSELTFAGALAGHRIPMVVRGGQLPIYAEADFCISGTVLPNKLLPEGPFGDHLGYYSLAHDFPVLRVDKVWHRDDAIWPFTVVGRPPQEDTNFGALIHELTGPVIPTVVRGVHAVHAVDASGVHPLLLAIGSERYTPYVERKQPQELLTQANAILGQGQLSLAKYLWIVDQADDPSLDIHDIAAFFQHVLRRVDWRRDLHFQTCTTIDTLDYSGSNLNAGSKLVIAAAGPPCRELPTELTSDWTGESTGQMTREFNSGAESGADRSSVHRTSTSADGRAVASRATVRMPSDFRNPRVVMPGVLAVEGPRLEPRPSFTPVPRLDFLSLFDRCESDGDAGRGASPDRRVQAFCAELTGDNALSRFPWIVIVDDSDFTAKNLGNFLWVVFTRSDPAADVYGHGAKVCRKHWGCHGPLVIDARIKPHHAPALAEDPEVTRRVDALAARGGPLARWL